MGVGRKNVRDSGGRDSLSECRSLRLRLRGRMARARALLGELGYGTQAEVISEGGTQWLTALWTPLEDPGTLLGHGVYTVWD